MSEPLSLYPPATLERPAEVWIIQPPRQRLWLHIALLIATFLSTMLVGAHMQANFASHQPVFSLNDDLDIFLKSVWLQPSTLLAGIPFSFTLMFILLAHEMGHYLYARHYHVYATLPFFIPFPSLIGTLGAFIRIKSPIPSRSVLFDIGVGGPIAGFFPSCIAVLVGLQLSHPLAAATGPLNNQPGFPLFFHVASHVLHIKTALTALSLHPIAAAGWVGMFATSLNLLPGGQLDGGHVFYAVLPRLHKWASLFTALALLLMARYFFWVWGLWAVILWLTSFHPPVPKRPGLSAARKWAASFALVMLILTFTPAPFSGASMRDAWPDMRDGARDGVHSLRDSVRHALHRR
jgi:hypothetical protein